MLHVGVQSSDPEEAWLLTKAASGGSQCIDLIPSCGGHIAHRLWTVGPDYRPLAVLQFCPRHTHLQLLRDYVWQLPGAQRFVEESRLSHLADTMLPHYDHTLLVAFIERWKPDTNIFHMPFGKMTITLHDIFHILRIPIKENPFIWKSGPDAYHEKTSKILDVSKTVVMDEFYYAGDGKVPTATFEAQIYLFCLLGYTLFSDTSGSRTKVGIIGGLTDVRLVAEKAWGAAALAHMYRELGKAFRPKGKNFSGCMTLLQSWIYEYFPSLRRADSPKSQDGGAPLAVRWDGVRLCGQSREEGSRGCTCCVLSWIA
ncbi:Protein MAIN-LIKE 1 [Linum grandiflorum]